MARLLVEGCPFRLVRFVQGKRLFLQYLQRMPDVVGIDCPCFFWAGRVHGQKGRLWVLWSPASSYCFPPAWTSDLSLTEIHWVRQSLSTVATPLGR